MFGEIYDLATGFAFETAVSLLVIFLLIDWAGNLSPKPGTTGPIDRLLYRSRDVVHLAFSWPIIWAHFLLASILCVLFLPPDRVVVGGLTDYYSQLAGVAAAIGFTLVFSIVLAVVGGYLLLKHAGAFINLLAGMVAYPILVAVAIPDHWLVGRLSEYAENARSGVIVAAWYPVPTAFVFGVGYWVDRRKTRHWRPGQEALLGQQPEPARERRRGVRRDSPRAAEPERPGRSLLGPEPARQRRPVPDQSQRRPRV